MTESIPNLWGVIRPEDISQKGSGNFKADYMNWALTAHLMHEHAPGWDFELVEWDDASGQPQTVYRAPDGSAYVVGRWYLNGTDVKTRKFPQACMDHRNNPILFEHVSARVVTDTERRCRCTSAASAFGLAGELWARVAVEDPHVDDNAAPLPPKREQRAKPKDKVAAGKKDAMLKFFATHGVKEGDIEKFIDASINEMNNVHYHTLQQIGAAIVKGMDAFEAMGIAAEDEEEDAFIIE